MNYYKSYSSRQKLVHDYEMVFVVNYNKTKTFGELNKEVNILKGKIGSFNGRINEVNNNVNNLRKEIEELKEMIKYMPGVGSGYLEAKNDFESTKNKLRIEEKDN